MTLQEFLALPVPFRWGGVGGEDCLTLLGRRTEDRIGVDPAARYRGTYASEIGAARIVKAAGGMVPLVASVAEPFGFARVQAGQEQDDDIAVVRVPSALTGKLAEIGAIRFGRLWLMIAQGRDGGNGGFKVTRAEHLAVWRLTV